MVELVWKGKYGKDKQRRRPLRIALPFQTVETVNETAQQRQKSLDLFAAGGRTEWRNRLIWGDKKYVLPSLLREFAGKIDLIYIDPPFATGSDFSFKAQVGDENFVKQPSIIEQKAYRDTWADGLDSYAPWFYETASLLHELLSETGNLYVHCDPTASHYIKLILDEIFGYGNFRNEIVWKRAFTRKSSLTKHLPRNHDILFPYTKSDDFIWNTDAVTIPYDLKNLDEKTKKKYSQKDARGRLFQYTSITAPGHSSGDSGKPITYEDQIIHPPPNKHWVVPGGRKKGESIQDGFNRLYAEGRLYQSYSGGLPRFKRYLDEQKGLTLDDLWTDIPSVNSMAKERTGYDTQKPEALLERIIKASSNEDDLILDCFCGSGTTAAVAEKLNRRWIAADLGRFAIHTTRKRLLGIENLRPFAVQNLGKYERQHWQKAELGAQAGNVLRTYRRFILDLFHAEAITGFSWLHGKKGRWLVHVGPVDSPIALNDITQIAIEFRQATHKGNMHGVQVLGWDFALDMNETQKQTAQEAGFELRFRRIPREVLEAKAVEQGDIQFFELAALALKATQKKRELHIELTDFIVPQDDVPKKVSESVRDWSDWIDYWAVDFDYRNDAFHNQWQTYRTRQDRSLRLSTSHRYAEPGNYTVLVKVIDILGNDTTKAIPIEVL